MQKKIALSSCGVHLSHSFCPDCTSSFNQIALHADPFLSFFKISQIIPIRIRTPHHKLRVDFLSMLALNEYNSSGEFNFKFLHISKRKNTHTTRRRNAKGKRRRRRRRGKCIVLHNDAMLPVGDSFWEDEKD